MLRPITRCKSKTRSIRTVNGPTSSRKSGQPHPCQVREDGVFLCAGPRKAYGRVAASQPKARASIGATGDAGNDALGQLAVQLENACFGCELGYDRRSWPIGSQSDGTRTTPGAQVPVHRPRRTGRRNLGCANQLVGGGSRVAGVFPEGEYSSPRRRCGAAENRNQPKRIFPGARRRCLLQSRARRPVLQ